MAYYYRRQNYSSGRGNSDIYYWPDSGENDVFFIFKPFAALAASIFKIPIFRNVVGFIVGIPIAVLLFLLIMIILLGIWIVEEMFNCWGKILDTCFYDLKNFAIWVYKIIAKKNNYIVPDSSR